jgi:hypothetical protein
VDAASQIVRVSQQAQLGVGFSTIYTVTYQRQFSASCFHVTNTTGAAQTVRIAAVPPAGIAGPGNALCWDFSIPANDFLEFGEGIILFSLWSIAGLASVGAAITVMVCGKEE